MPNVDDLRAIKDRAEADLMKRPGVTAVDVGYRYVGGQKTNDVAIRVHVEKKKDLKDLKPEEVIPATIEGAPTDVVERRYVLQAMAPPAQPDTTHDDPLVGGASIGPCRSVNGSIFAGTLGLIVKDAATGAPLMLSNFHVMCIDSTFTNGSDTIAQPSQIDTGVCDTDVVGVLQREALAGFTPGATDVDCAVASITARGHALRMVKDIGAIAGVDTANLGDSVQKRGRTTGLTSGSVDGVGVTVSIDYGPGIGVRTLTNQISLVPYAGQIGNHGDSGSVVVNAMGSVIGLYFAGSDDGSAGLANPIQSVIAALGIAI